jgi:ferritin
MKLSNELNDALCLQIVHELTNVSKYMQIASYFENLQLKKIADYFKAQSNQEKEHADKFMNHINDRTGGIVNIGEIPEPKLGLTDVFSVADAFVRTEEDTTASIEDLYDMAFSEKSYIDLPFLSTMLDEQVEEEDSATHFSARIKSVKDLVLFDSTFEN